jgi:hypothetical protein
MKFKPEKDRVTDEEARILENDVRRLDASSTDVPDQPPVYWQNLIVRTNARIDAASSGKALSISWAARVAIPGVVAIVSFLVGLHYYVPEPAGDDTTVETVVLSLPASSLDSMMSDPSRVDPALSVADVGSDLFDLSSEQITDYLIVHGAASTAVEALSDSEKTELLAVLTPGER